MSQATNDGPAATGSFGAKVLGRFLIRRQEQPSPAEAGQGAQKEARRLPEAKIIAANLQPLHPTPTPLSHLKDITQSKVL